MPPSSAAVTPQTCTSDSGVEVAADSPLTCSKALAAKFNFAHPDLHLPDNHDNPTTSDSDSTVLHLNGGGEQAHPSEQSPASPPVHETLSAVDHDVARDHRRPDVPVDHDVHSHMKSWKPDPSHESNCDASAAAIMAAGSQARSVPPEVPPQRQERVDPGPVCATPPDPPAQVWLLDHCSAARLEGSLAVAWRQS